VYIKENEKNEYLDFKQLIGRMTLHTLIVKNYLHGPYRMGSVAFDGGVPTLHRWLPFDRIDADNKVAERKSPILLDGVLDLVNRTGQGFSPRGVPLYLFYPLDATWPPFLVAYKNHSAVNLLVQVQFEHWNSGPWPRAGLVRTHGNVGNAEIEHRLLQTTFAGCAPLANNDTCELIPTISTHETAHWDYVFNIDPASTTDVDDIFAWRCSENIVHFMIAIADVAAWIPSDSAHDKRARELGETFYDEGTVITPMLPSYISEVCASLRNDGITRPVIGLEFTIRDGVIIGCDWHRYNITLTANYSYESVCDAAISLELYNLLCIVCHNSPDAEDTHDWVAQAMITYNHNAAKVLARANIGLLRRHAGISNNEFERIAVASGCKEIAHLGMTAGEYCIASELQTMHSGLDLNVYCHATSPLRRYSDLENQRILTHLLFGTNYVTTQQDLADLADLADHLNIRSRAARTLERELWFLRHIEPLSISIVEGVLLQCKDSIANRWAVYVPEWRRKISGVVNAGTVCDSGNRVTLRVFCDLRSANWRNRIVCQITSN